MRWRQRCDPHEGDGKERVINGCDDYDDDENDYKNFDEENDENEEEEEDKR